MLEVGVRADATSMESMAAGPTSSPLKESRKAFLSGMPLSCSEKVREMV